MMMMMLPEPIRYHSFGTVSHSGLMLHLSGRYHTMMVRGVCEVGIKLNQRHTTNKDRLTRCRLSTCFPLAVESINHGGREDGGSDIQEKAPARLR